MSCHWLNIMSLRTWIRETLGEPIVCVEMTDEQIDKAIETAFMWFSAYRGWYKEANIQIVSGQVEYDLSTIDPCVSDVMKVWFSLDPRLDFSRVWPGFLDVEGIPYDQTAYGQVDDHFYSGVVQFLQSREIASRVLSADRDWFYNLDTQILSVTPADIDSGVAVIQYSTPFKKEYLEKLPAEFAFVVREYALARTKYILGRIRGKYTGGLPAAQGNVTLDGADLIREAQEDYERLEQRMLDLMPPPGIVIG